MEADCEVCVHCDAPVCEPSTKCTDASCSSVVADCVECVQESCDESCTRADLCDGNCFAGADYFEQFNSYPPGNVEQPFPLSRQIGQQSLLGPAPDQFSQFDLVAKEFSRITTTQSTSPALSIQNPNYPPQQTQSRPPSFDSNNFQNLRIPHRCLWNSCEATFETAADLVAHVHHNHLWWSRTDAPYLHHCLDHESTKRPTPSDLNCLWDHCSAFPELQNATSSSGNQNTLPTAGLLASHLLHDHLGIDIFANNTQSEKACFPGNIPIGEGNITVGVSSDAATSSNGCPSNNICRWDSCGLTFASCAELNDHICEVHVGNGQAHYICHWEGCPRGKQQPFASKQKILRHIQTHTGHRPFQCTVCKQFFSEAATLQQHMRRHTQEKPYVCNHPGCEKSFAIMGALTIHKRVHNGVKPFKCNFCGRGFAESSNLAKHIRTHTGHKPYECKVCAKKFSRPDQLNRHASIHKVSNSAN